MEVDMEDTVAREGRFTRVHMYCTVGRWRVHGLDCTHTHTHTRLDCAGGRLRAWVPRQQAGLNRGIMMGRLAGGDIS